MPTAWHEIHNGNEFERFPSREFLQAALGRLQLDAKHPSALELGCGTGPGACFLAECGFVVHGVDLIADAIEIARQQAQSRGLDISYEVMDVVELPHDGETYDLIVDSYCLQGIVTDDDRCSLFAAVRSRLAAPGYYLISTAHFDERRFAGDRTVVDATDGRVYHPYGDDGIIDPATDIVYIELTDDRQLWADCVPIAGRSYLPYRRHRKPAGLARELTAAGFDVLYQDKGDLICTHKGSGVSLK